MKARFIPVLALLGAVCMLASPAAAPAASAAPSPSGAPAIIARIEARNPSLSSFQSRVHVNVRMLNFPFLSPQLDGTSYYKRSAGYEVVFDRVPSYARGLRKLFTTIDDAAAWQRDCNVTYEGVQTVDGHPYMVLSMSKKIRSDQIKAAIAYIDPATYQIARMEWRYFNGGSIVMTQTYRTQNGFSLIASQHADIHIPHVRAVADASYSRYSTNVAVGDAVFTGGH